MASEQISQNVFIAQAVAEATRMANQTMATTGSTRQGNAETKKGRSNLKPPTLNQRAEDKYEELQNFELEVSNM